MKILVIEDDSSISELICMNLEAAGYQPHPVGDGLTAQKLLESGQMEDSALALVDVMLPGKDGFALMEDLQKARIPVIYLTAKSDVLSKVHGLKNGAEDYIVKPFEILELLFAGKIPNILSIYGNTACRNIIKPGNQINQCRLAASGTSNNRRCFSRLCCKINLF